MDPATSKAIAAGFPPYVEPERRSFPRNSSPYRVTSAELRTVFSDDSVRSSLLQALEEHLETFSQYGLVFPAVLIGGGFVRKIPAAPSDIDALVFYRFATQAVEPGLRALSSSQVTAKARKLDLRYCPLDADPLAMIQSTAFFSVLYSKQEGDLLIRNGLILMERPIVDQ